MCFVVTNCYYFDFDQDQALFDYFFSCAETWFFLSTRFVVMCVPHSSHENGGL